MATRGEGIPLFYSTGRPPGPRSGEALAEPGPEAHDGRWAGGPSPPAQEGDMRALVIYESMFGATHDVADRIAEGLRTAMGVGVAPAGATARALTPGRPGGGRSAARRARPARPALAGPGRRRWPSTSRPVSTWTPTARPRVCPDWLAGLPAPVPGRRLRHPDGHRRVGPGQPGHRPAGSATTASAWWPIRPASWSARTTAWSTGRRLGPRPGASGWPPRRPPGWPNRWPPDGGRAGPPGRTGQPRPVPGARSPSGPTARSA